MKLAEVEVGGIYSVKVSGRLTLVRVVAVRRGGESGFGRRQPSFVGVNVRTGREVRGGLARLRERRLREKQPGGASLIAAAPDLLEALREYVERHEAEGDPAGLPEYEKACAAIAKAEGR